MLPLSPASWFRRSASSGERGRGAPPAHSTSRRSSNPSASAPMNGGHRPAARRDVPREIGVAAIQQRRRVPFASKSGMSPMIMTVTGTTPRRPSRSTRGAAAEALKTPALVPAKGGITISDDQIRDSSSAQLKLQRSRGTDVTISPRASARAPSATRRPASTGPSIATSSSTESATCIRRTLSASASCRSRLASTRVA